MSDITDDLDDIVFGVKKYRSFPEEFKHGCYQSTCTKCDKEFLGNKGRVYCKICLADVCEGCETFKAIAVNLNQQVSELKERIELIKKLATVAVNNGMMNPYLIPHERGVMCAYKEVVSYLNLSIEDLRKE